MRHLRVTYWPRFRRKPRPALALLFWLLALLLRFSWRELRWGNSRPKTKALESLLLFLPSSKRLDYLEMLSPSLLEPSCRTLGFITVIDSSLLQPDGSSLCLFAFFAWWDFSWGTVRSIFGSERSTCLKYNLIDCVMVGGLVTNKNNNNLWRLDPCKKKILIFLNFQIFFYTF